MKKLIVLLIFFFSIVSLSRAEDAPQPKIKEGFRDLSFGTKVSEISGLVVVGKIGDYITYKRPADVLLLGKTPLDSIVYGFWQGKLAIVYLDVKTTMLSMAFHEIDEFLYSIYGKPARVKPMDSSGVSKENMCQEIWEDDKTCIIYTIWFKPPAMASNRLGLPEYDMSVVIKSKEIESEMMKAKGEINSESPNGL